MIGFQQELSLLQLDRFKQAIPVTVTPVSSQEDRFISGNYFSIETDMAHSTKVNKKNHPA